MKKFFRICHFGFLSLIVFSLFVLPTLSLAQAANTTGGSGFQIITCGTGTSGAMDCGFDDLRKTVGNVFKYAIEYVILPLATITLIWAGFKIIWESSRGRDSSLYRQVLKNVVIGLALAVGAYAIVRTFISLFFNDEGAFQDIIKEVFSGG